VEGVVHASEHISGIGVAMKGLVDHQQGVMVSSTTLRMRGLPVRSFLEEEFGLLVAVDNDVHAATIGEIYYGAGRRFRHLLYLNVGTGVAVGLVFDGKLYRGATNLSGEFGHNTVDRNGWACRCGMRGCVEAFASGPGIVSQVLGRVKHHPASPLAALARSDELSATEVFRAAQQGDALALQVLHDTVEHLGAGLVNLVNLLNPEAIILGGSVFNEAGIFVDRLAQFVKAHPLRDSAASLQEIGPSSLGVNEVGLVGAASLIWEYQDLYPPA
jgi:glucokinase